MINKIKRGMSYLGASAVALATTPLTALAISGNDLKGIGSRIIITQQNGTNIITGVAATVINLILLFAGILAVIYLVISGVTYVTAGGDTAKAEKGRTGIVNAIIGLVIISAAYIIVRFVGGALEFGEETNKVTNVVF